MPPIFLSAPHHSQSITGAMDRLWIRNAGDAYKDQSQNHNQRDITTQSVISIAFGLIAFLAFCVSTDALSFILNKANADIKTLRPRWTSLYAARKRQKDAAEILPDLPDTFFGWIPVLYRISDDKVLKSAGLDAYVVSRIQYCFCQRLT